MRRLCITRLRASAPPWQRKLKLPPRLGGNRPLPHYRLGTGCYAEETARAAASHVERGETTRGGQGRRPRRRRRRPRRPRMRRGRDRPRRDPRLPGRRPPLSRDRARLRRLRGLAHRAQPLLRLLRDARIRLRCPRPRRRCGTPLPRGLAHAGDRPAPPASPVTADRTVSSVPVGTVPRAASEWKWPSSWQRTTWITS